MIWTNPKLEQFMEFASHACGYDICIGPPGGDVAYPGAPSQRLHTDYASYSIRSMRYGFSMAVSLAVVDVEEDMAPLRICGWDNLDSHKYPDMPAEPPEMCTMMLLPYTMLDHHQLMGVNVSSNGCSMPS